LPLENSKIFILEADDRMSSDIRSIVGTQGYRTKSFATLPELSDGLVSGTCKVVMLDLDSVPLDNRTIRNLALSFPSVSFFGLSRDRFHPELRDAICYHLFACLTRPIDPDELVFFLKCIRHKLNKEEV
jgi:DNA-binding NtrC family response regulator